MLLKPASEPVRNQNGCWLWNLIEAASYRGRSLTGSLNPRKNMIKFILPCILILTLSCTSPERYGSSLTPGQQREQIGLQYQKTGERIEKGQIRFDGGDGLSIENAIIINGAENEKEGIIAELIYIGKKHGEKNADWKPIMQGFLNKNGKSYDEIKIEDIKNNNNISYYFDITAFFGKY